jgi:2-polyprenyl-6-hydroxyphenyl methylase/3-demethylubiquinone-9 3-methyltransferase
MNHDEQVRYFDEAATSWTARYQNSPHFQFRLDTALRWLGLPSDVTGVLDYGCGSGIFAVAAARRGFDVTAVDQSEMMLGEARRNFRQLTAGRFTLEHVRPGDTNCRFSRREYHFVSCLGVLEYVEDDEALLETLSAVIRPGGVLILSVPNEASAFRMIEGIIRRGSPLLSRVPFLKTRAKALRYLDHQQHQYRARDLRRRLACLGLHEEELVYHATPRAFASWARSERFGMTFLGRYRKASPSGRTLLSGR